jgi:hypothetical protein
VESENFDSKVVGLANRNELVIKIFPERLPCRDSGVNRDFQFLGGIENFLLVRLLELDDV